MAGGGASAGLTGEPLSVGRVVATAKVVAGFPVRMPTPVVRVATEGQWTSIAQGNSEHDCDRVSIWSIDRQPSTTNLHLFLRSLEGRGRCVSRCRDRCGLPLQWDPSYREYAPGYYAAYLLDPGGNNLEALYRDVGNPGHTAAE